MKMLRKLVFVLGVAAAGLMTSTASLAFTVNITVDENGKGLLTNTAGFSSALAASMIADPGPGGLPSVLNYDLLGPPQLTIGDVRILDPDGSLSDLIRFSTIGNGSLFFYSELGGGDLADVGLPTGLNTNVITLTEGSLGGGLWGVDYTPVAGQAGFVAGAGGAVTYRFVSSTELPEPGSLALTALALLLCSVGARRQRGG